MQRNDATYKNDTFYEAAKALFYSIKDNLHYKVQFKSSLFYQDEVLHNKLKNYVHYFTEKGSYEIDDMEAIKIGAEFTKFVNLAYSLIVQNINRTLQFSFWFQAYQQLADPQKPHENKLESMLKKELDTLNQTREILIAERMRLSMFGTPTPRKKESLVIIPSPAKTL